MAILPVMESFMGRGLLRGKDIEADDVIEYAFCAKQPTNTHPVRNLGETFFLQHKIQTQFL